MKTSAVTKGGLVAPLKAKDGVAPSRVWLPLNGTWTTMGAFLIERFPFVAQEDLLRRLIRGDIVDGMGVPVSFDSPYQSEQWLWYYRQVENEVVVPFDMPILYADDTLIAVDKPHFLATIPGGQYLQQTALTRVRQHFDDASISPLHRLDRETAGILLFCRRLELRGAYQHMFQTQAIDKQYEAIAMTNTQVDFPLVHRSHLHAPKGLFKVREIEAEPNSETAISVLRSWVDPMHGELSLYGLRPVTGRKHQLRVHMQSLGTPILQDRYYPDGQPYSEADDFSQPLQLLARSIGFVDPVTQTYKHFESQQRLACLPD